MLACSGVPGQACSISVVGTSHGRKRAGTILAVTASKRQKPKVRTVTVKVTVLQGSFTVPAGQGATVQVTLNSVGKQLLARFRKLPVTLSFTGSLTTAETVVFTSNLTRLSVSTPPDDWFHINLPCANCFTTAQSVPLAGLPKGARVSVACNGAGCSFARGSVAAHHGHANLASVLGRSRLQPGTKVTVVISAPGRVSEVIVYTMQRGAGPVRTIE
jgi:hypothetical protein